MWVTGDRIQKFTPEGNISVFKVVSYPYGLCIDSNNILYDMSCEVCDLFWLFSFISAAASYM